jgi:hypothetical protein
MGEERFRKAFEFMVEQAIALGAVKGYVVAIDSTAFKAYSARDSSNKRVNLILTLMLEGLEEHTF